MPVQFKESRAKTTEAKQETASAQATQEAASASPPAASAAAPPETNPAQPAHLGDWVALYIWVACFLLMMVMNWYDLLRALINF